MARKPIVDRNTVLEMLRDGQTTQHVADHFGVTRQAVDLHRKDFIAHGLLANQRAARSSRTAPPSGPEITPVQQAVVQASLAPSPRELAGLPLDQIIDLAIDAFAALKKLPETEAERDRYRQLYETAVAEMDRLKEAESRRHNQEQRWFLAQK